VANQWTQGRSFFEEKMQEIKGYLRRIELLGNAMGVLNWDLEVNVPPGGVKGRAEVLGYLSGEMYKLITAPEAGEYIAWLEKISPIQFIRACCAK